MCQTPPGASLLREQGERKYLLDAGTAREVWQRASAHLQLQLRDFARPITYHRTTYFDTPDHAYYRGVGPVSRRVRVREYATACRQGSAPVLMRPCFLELKQSANGMRSKTRLQVDGGPIDKHLAQFGDAGLVPCLTTWYQRAALTDADENIRITLDSDVRYCPPLPIGAPCAADPAAYARANALIFEVKVCGVLPPWLRSLVRTLQEATDFSKFRAGMRAAADVFAHSEPAARQAS